MDTNEMQRIFQAHRDAEAARDYDGILATFVEDCFLDTVALGLRTVGRAAVRTAYEGSYFAAFPDLTPEDQGSAFGDDAVVAWGTLNGTSRGTVAGDPALRPVVLRAVHQRRVLPGRAHAR